MATNASSAARQSQTAPNAPSPEELDDDLEEAAPPARKKRGLLKMLFLLTLLGGAGGGAWLLFGTGGAQTEEAPLLKAAKSAKVKSVKAKAVSSEPPVFVALEPFTVNLQRDDTSQQYLQLGLSLKVDDKDYIDTIKLHMPEIRNRVLLLLSNKKASDISTLEGKKALSAELRKEIAQPLAGRVPPQGLDSVLFTSFVIQ